MQLRAGSGRRSESEAGAGRPLGEAGAVVGEEVRGHRVGCGEGADTIWLARRGWQVTAVDISRVALQRAASTATDITGRVAWTQADLTATRPPAGAFDLVSVQPFPLPRQPDRTALRGLLAADAPDGTLRARLAAWSSTGSSG